MNYLIKFSPSFLLKLGLLFCLLFYSVSGITQTRSESFSVEGLTNAQLSEMLVKEQILLIDVRTPAEFEQGHLKGALLIEYQNIGQEIEKYAVDKNMPIALYCRSGRRSGVAASILVSQGYQNVLNLGGYEMLKQMGYSTQNP